LIRQQYK